MPPLREFTHRLISPDDDDGLSQFVASLMQEELPMTVGTGTLCNYREQGNSFILLSVDDKASYANPRIAPNNNCGKFRDLLPDPFCLSISGAIDVCDGVVAEFHEKIKQRREKREDHLIYPDDLRVAIREARRYEYGQFLKDELQGYLNISMEEWMKSSNKEISRKGFLIARAARLHFPVHIIAGGFTAGNAVLMRSPGACITEMGVGPYVVGSGSVEALNHLNRRSQNHHYTAARSILHMDEAMDKARRAHPKTVGHPVDYVAIRQNGEIMRFPAKSPLLKKWRNDFKKKDTSIIDTDRSFQKDFERELLPHKRANV